MSLWEKKSNSELSANQACLLGFVAAFVNVAVGGDLDEWNRPFEKIVKYLMVLKIWDD